MSKRTPKTRLYRSFHKNQRFKNRKLKLIKKKKKRGFKNKFSFRKK